MAITYKLLTPGPLTTTDTLKREMLFCFSPLELPIIESNE